MIVADSSVIKEFLVALGFTVSEAGLKKFSDGIVTAGKQTVAFAATVVAAQVAVNAFVVEAAENFEKLYYASQRAGTSAENLKALQYGFSQIGLGADAATHTLESFALALKMNPAQEGFLRSLGIATRDAPGKMRDTAAIVTDFAKKLSSMPPWLAGQIAQMFGISAQQLFQMQRYAGELEKAQQNSRATAKAFGVDLDEYARNSHEFMTGLRQLGNDIDMIWAKVSGELIKDLTPALIKIHEYLELHGPELSKVGVSIGRAFTDVGGDIGKVLLQIGELITATDSWRLVIEAIVVLIATRIFGPIGLLLSALVIAKAKLDDIGKDAKKRSEEPGHHDDYIYNKKGEIIWDKGMSQVGPGFFKWFMDTIFGKAEEEIHRESFHPTGGGGGSGGTIPVSYRPQGTPFAQAPSVAEPNGPGTIAERHNNPGNLRASDMSTGTSRGFAVFDNAVVGFTAMARQLLRYAERGIDTVQGIITKWAPSFENDTTGYIRNLANRLGVSPGQHLDLHNPELLSKLMLGIAHVETGKDPWGKDVSDEGARAALGQGAGGGRGNINMQQKTDIHVHGSDPKTTADEVAVRQRGVNADVIRNLNPVAVYA